MVPILNCIFPLLCSLFSLRFCLLSCSACFGCSHYECGFFYSICFIAWGFFSSMHSMIGVSCTRFSYRLGVLIHRAASNSMICSTLSVFPRRYSLCFENQKREENIEQVFFIFPGKWRRREKRNTQEERREQVLWVSTIMTVTATSSAGDDGVIEEAKEEQEKMSAPVRSVLFLLHLKVM